MGGGSRRAAGAGAREADDGDATAELEEAVTVGASPREAGPREPTTAPSQPASLAWWAALKTAQPMWPAQVLRRGPVLGQQQAPWSADHDHDQQSIVPEAD